MTAILTAIVNPTWVLNCRISTTSTLANRNLFAWGLPPFTLGNYLTYSQIFPQSQGGSSRQGYINDSLLWDEMSAIQLQILVSIVNTTLTSGTIWLTIPKDNGTGANAFIDISGKPSPVTYTPSSDGRGLFCTNVGFKINNITVINDPASGL